MKILILIASPRKQGNSTLVSSILADKLKSLGCIFVDTIYLSDLELKLCRGCCNCLTIGEDYCPNKNDNRKLLEAKLLDSDGVIFISPVYAMNMSALMKNFMDRFAFSMHRPRFFKQYTMLVAVTGAFGLPETINGMKQLQFCGFNIIQTLGLKVSNPLINVELSDKRLIELIEKSALKFHTDILKQKPVRPSLINLISYKIQRKYFCSLKEKAPCDWEYFNKKGWFNSKNKYYTNNSKICVLKDLISSLVAKIS